MTPEQWRNREHEQPMPPKGAEWAIPLVLWLQERGYLSVENGPYNPATGRGWYSQPCEYQHKHVRVRINRGGAIILRDPGCTIQVTGPTHHGMTEFVNPNMNRLDWPHVDLAHMQRAIEAFESHPAWIPGETGLRWFGEQ